MRILSFVLTPKEYFHCVVPKKIENREARGGAAVDGRTPEAVERRPKRVRRQPARQQVCCQCLLQWPIKVREGEGYPRMEDSLFSRRLVCMAQS